MPDRRHILFAVLFMALMGCSATIKPPGPVIQSAQLDLDHNQLVMADGMALPLHAWLPEAGQQPEAPDAVVLAVHGFNDYGAYFKELALHLNKHNIAAYAYDQRGFGASDNTGYWAGHQAYVSDAVSVLKLIKQRHPDVPVFGFGESMGGAVLMAASVTKGMKSTLQIDGLILAAPAVWGRATMPWYQKAVLWAAVRTVPSMTLSGRGLKITPSDNIEMLRALGRDPLIIKETRVDALWGVVNLMDRALESAQNFHTRSLILYGERDEIIEQQLTKNMLARLPANPESPRLIATYENGYHMLIRDLGAKTVWDDILAWIKNPNTRELPSGAEQRRDAFFKGN